MKTAAVNLGLALAVAINGPALHAAEKKEVYVSSAEQKTLLEKPLPGVEGKQMTIIHATVPPGWIGGKHHHTGPVYVYVLDGSFTIEEAGKARQTFKAGELYEEPIGTPMQARNMSASEPLRFLVIQVSRPGEPLMYKAE